MPKKKSLNKPARSLISPLESFLILLGTPPLLVIKFALELIIRLGQLTLRLTHLALTHSTRLPSFFKTTFLALVASIRVRGMILSRAAYSGLSRLKNSLSGLFPLLSRLLKRPTRLAYGLLQKPPSPRPLALPPLRLFPALKLPFPALLLRLPARFRDFTLLVVGAFLFFIFVFLPYQAHSFVTALPHPRALAVRDIPVSTKIYDRNGILLYQFYADENRSLVSLKELPPHLIKATLAIEDKNFYRHRGIDPQGIVRAAVANANGTVLQGGSTITQQLIKSALLTPERTYLRKTKELLLALWTEMTYTKDEILTMYFNQVPYGGTAYGIEAAAQTYFRKSAKDLTLAESALLAGLPSSPTTYSPFGSHPELARTRQRQVLKAMLSAGFITPAEEQAALSEKLTFANPETSIKAPHFVMYVKDYLVSKYGSRITERGGLEVTTSLDYPLYERVSEIVKTSVANQKNLGVGNGSALVTNPATGEILAMVGSTDFFDIDHDGNVNITLAERSPGSSIKPLTYALAFEKNLLSPSTLIDDSPTAFSNPGSPPYRPQNYDNRFHGRMPVRVALAASYNIPAVKTLEKVGLSSFLTFAREAGLTTFTDPSRYGLSITLGGGEVRMVDMATAYSLFPNNGRRVDLKPVLKVTDYRGRLLEDNTVLSSTAPQLISPRSAFFINSILSDDLSRAPTFGRNGYLVVPGHTVAVKTGTTETKRDNWTIGYSFGPNPRLVAVWVGNNDNSPMSPWLESGNTGAAAIWNPIMSHLLKDTPDSPIPQPSDLRPIQICATTGTLPCEYCPVITTEYFAPGQEPKVACNITKEDREKFEKQLSAPN